MSELCNISGQVLYKIENGYVKDFYGRFCYIFDGNEIREWDSRKIIYKFDGNNIKDFVGRTLYSFDGTYLRDFYGKYLYTFDGTYISKWAGLKTHYVRGHATNIEVAVYLILFIVDGDY